MYKNSVILEEITSSAKRVHEASIDKHFFMGVAISEYKYKDVWILDGRYAPLVELLVAGDAV
jgi:hypothetical protein